MLNEDRINPTIDIEEKEDKALGDIAGTCTPTPLSSTPSHSACAFIHLFCCTYAETTRNLFSPFLKVLRTLQIIGEDKEEEEEKGEEKEERKEGKEEEEEEEEEEKEEKEEEHGLEGGDVVKNTGKGDAKTRRGGWFFPAATVSLILICTIIGLTCVLQEMKYGYSALYSSLVLVSHPFYIRTDLYRLVTTVFVHSGSEHLFVNMIAFALFGYLYEKEAGWKKLLVLYFLTAVLTSLFSLLHYTVMMTAYELPGASGAVFAVAFAYAGERVIRYFRRMTTQNPAYLVLILVFCLHAGSGGQSTNDIAHTFGATIGVIFTIYHSRQLRGKYMWRRGVEIGAIAALLILTNSLPTIRHLEAQLIGVAEYTEDEERRYGEYLCTESAFRWAGAANVRNYDTLFSNYSRIETEVNILPEDKEEAKSLFRDMFEGSGSPQVRADGYDVVEVEDGKQVFRTCMEYEERGQKKSIYVYFHEKDGEWCWSY